MNNIIENLLSSIGKDIGFTVHPKTILKDDFSNVKLLSVTNHDNAVGFNLAEMHSKVYPLLPENSPNSFKDYLYIVVRLPSGITRAIGLPWIEEDSFKIHTTTDINITVHNVDSTQLDTIKRILAANGYPTVTVSISK